MTDEVKALSDDEVARIQKQNQYDGGLIINPERDALCATVRALRVSLAQAEQAFELESAVRLPEVGNLNVLQIVKKMAELHESNTALREQLTQTELARDQLSVALSVRDEQLAAAQLLSESTLDHNRALIAELAQVTQGRDRLQEQLAEGVAKRVNSNVERMEQSQKITQTELEHHCSDDRLTDTQRGSYQD